MYKHLVAFTAIALSFAGIATADNWPEWRGPNSNGLAEGNPPVTWSETENIKWKVPVPGTASSTPIVWGDKLFITTSVMAGEPEPEPKERPKRGEAPKAPSIPYKFIVMCIDRATGATLWEHTAIEAVPHESHHPTSTFAPYSAATDGSLVWVSFGSRGLYCYDFDGNLKWSQDLFPMTMSNAFGEGISATLADETIIVLMDHEGESKLLAFDKISGEPRWEVLREEGSTWATPLVATIDGKQQVIANGMTHIKGYDAKTGEVLWASEGLDDATIPMPVIGHGNVYVASGYRKPKLRAIKLGGSGDLGDAAKVWEVDKYTPYVGSPLLYDERIYVTRGLSGNLSCFNAMTGEAIYERENLEGISQVYASPVGVAGRIYIPGRKGTTVVVKHSDTFEILATNVLDDGFDGSPVVIGNELYLKGAANLYCIAEK